MADGGEVEDEAGGEAGHVAEDDDEDALLLAPFCGEEETGEEHGSGLDDAGADVEEDGVEGAVTKAFDDEAGEGGLKWVGHVVEEDSADEEPNFDVFEGLDYLGLLVVGVFDAGLI